MNLSTSECSSGCESGWTTYLDQFSANSTNLNTKNYVQNYEEKRENVNDYEDEDEDEDEDLSMVSDASSGPPKLRLGPHYYEDTKKGNNCKKKSKSKEMINVQQNFCLDDTASSPILHNFNQDNAVPPGQMSQDESTQKMRFGFLKSSVKGKSGSFLGRKRQ